VTLAPGQRLPVHSTKYDGSLHYRYEVTVVREEPDRLLVYEPIGSLATGHRGPVRTRHPMLHVHTRDRYWNLSVMWEPDWQRREHYVNIALPSTWDDGTLRFVDLDLDLIWKADGTVLLDDEDEFDLRTIRFAYPPALVERAWRAADEVRGLIARRAAPFDGALYEWRPTELWPDWPESGVSRSGSSRA